MNRTTDNATLLSCGVEFLPVTPAKVSPDLRAVFIARIVLNALTCPLIIFLNILLMVAVKTKRQLRTKSNVAIACLATTDLAVGLVVKPLQMACWHIIAFQGKPELFCSLNETTIRITRKCVWASLYHLLLMSAERYLAVKYPFAYENQVTEVRIMIASGLAWAAAITPPLQDYWSSNSQFLAILKYLVIMFVFFPALIYFNVAVYIEVRRSEKQIAANQVSAEAKEKIFKNKKAFYTTAMVLLLIFLSYFLAAICLVIVISFNETIPINRRHILFSLVTQLLLLNSLFNPLLYAVRMRSFRVAFIQLFSRKTFAQAEELERKIFGPRQIEVTANIEQGQNEDNQEENEQQGNETLNNRHEQNSAGQEEEEQQGNVTLNNRHEQNRAGQEENEQQGNERLNNGHEQNRAGQEENEQQGNETLNNGHEQNRAGQEENEQQGNETLNNGHEQNRAGQEENEQQGNETLNNGHEQNRAGQEEEEQQGNETLNYGLVITVQTQQQKEYEDTTVTTSTIVNN